MQSANKVVVGGPTLCTISTFHGTHYWKKLLRCGVGEFPRAVQEVKIRVRGVLFRVEFTGTRQ